jgi:hypothetical protein
VSAAVRLLCMHATPPRIALTELVPVARRSLVKTVVGAALNVAKRDSTGHSLCDRLEQMMCVFLVVVVVDVVVVVVVVVVIVAMI